MTALPSLAALLAPRRAEPQPAVILVHGAEPGQFDDPAFNVHANAFVAAGFPVLVYDKRGSGSSSGALALADYDELATDLTSAIRLIELDISAQPGLYSAFRRPFQPCM